MVKIATWERCVLSLLRVDTFIFISFLALYWLQYAMRSQPPGYKEMWRLWSFSKHEDMNAGILKRKAVAVWRMKCLKNARWGSAALSQCISSEMFVQFISAKHSQMNSARLKRKLNSSPLQFFLLCQMVIFVHGILFFVLEGSPNFFFSHLKIIAFLNVVRRKGKRSGLLSFRWGQAVLDLLGNRGACWSQVLYR